MAEFTNRPFEELGNDEIETLFAASKKQDESLDDFWEWLAAGCGSCYGSSDPHWSDSFVSLLSQWREERKSDQEASYGPSQVI